MWALPHKLAAEGFDFFSVCVRVRVRVCGMMNILWYVIVKNYVIELT